MVAWAIPAALGAAGLISGLLGDDDNDDGDKYVQSAQIGARKSYPGQHATAKKLAPYLWENVDIGLTEKEKELFRGAGKTSILQGVSGARNQARKTYSSQGLRGGTVASALSRIDESRIPALGKLETDIYALDSNLKRKRIAELLAFLGLEAGIDPDAVTGGGNQAATGRAPTTIAEILQGFPGVGGGETDGLGDSPGQGMGLGDSSGVGGMDSAGGGVGIGGY